MDFVSRLSVDIYIYDTSSSAVCLARLLFAWVALPQRLSRPSNDFLPIVLDENDNPINQPGGGDDDAVIARIEIITIDLIE